MASETKKTSSKCIVQTGFGGYEKLSIEYRPIPTPARGKIVMQVMACGVNFSELMCLQGTYDRISMSKLPAISGFEASGVVVNIGPDVTSLKNGQRIVCMADMGLWSEFAEVGADHCFVIPDSMSFEDAAALLLNYVPAWHMLFDFGNLRPGKSVLIHMAAGGVGIAATQMCHTVPDVTVFGTSSASKHNIIKKNGVTHAIDYRTTDYAEEVRRISPEGVDIVLDPLNGADAVKGYKLLKRLGTIIHFGAANAVTGPNRSYWNILTTYLSTRSYNPVFMLGDNKSACGYHLGAMIDEPAMYEKVVPELLKLYEAGKIKPIIDSVWLFEDIGKAMARMHNRQNIGKILITPGTIKQFVRDQ